jgi:hypothetical protein
MNPNVTKDNLGLISSLASQIQSSQKQDCSDTVYGADGTAY